MNFIKSLLRCGIVFVFLKHETVDRNGKTFHLLMMSSALKTSNPNLMNVRRKLVQLLMSLTMMMMMVMMMGVIFFLHKHITRNILSITNIRYVYQYNCVDPAYRYRCAIFCTQVLFLIKRKHHSSLTSTAKAK